MFFAHFFVRKRKWNEISINWKNPEFEIRQSAYYWFWFFCVISFVSETCQLAKIIGFILWFRLIREVFVEISLYLSVYVCRSVPVYVCSCVCVCVGGGVMLEISNWYFHYNKSLIFDSDLYMKTYVCSCAGSFHKLFINWISLFPFVPRRVSLFFTYIYCFTQSMLMCVCVYALMWV